MNRFIIGGLLMGMSILPVEANPEVKGWKTMDSMGCMMVRDCTEGVIKINSVADIEAHIQHANYDSVREEADGIISELKKMGVNVYLAADKYFPRGHAGVYYTVGNDFFLNITWSDDPVSMIRTLRHEAWHAAQDAMAGTIKNNNIAIIRPEEDVPRHVRIATEAAYGPNSPALPWEKEAKWAGETPNMTLEVLRTINRTGGKPWTEIEPTPLTRLWLERNGYL